MRFLPWLIPLAAWPLALTWLAAIAWLVLQPSFWLALVLVLGVWGYRYDWCEKR
jgi:hypothetical protein